MMREPNYPALLTELAFRLDAEGISYRRGQQRRAFPSHNITCRAFDEPSLIINGWAANFDRWGYVIDQEDNENFLDQGDLESAVKFIHEVVLS